jgi:hypothetical protein
MPTNPKAILAVLTGLGFAGIGLSVISSMSTPSSEVVGHTPGRSNVAGAFL